MWKWTPHVVHAFNGGFIMTPKDEVKKAPKTKQNLMDEIQSKDERFRQDNLKRINMTHLKLIIDLLG